MRDGKTMNVDVTLDKEESSVNGSGRLRFERNSQNNQNNQNGNGQNGYGNGNGNSNNGNAGTGNDSTAATTARRVLRSVRPVVKPLDNAADAVER